MFRRLTARLAFTIGVGLAGAMVVSGVASAGWSDADCDPSAQSCEFEVGTDPEPAPAPGEDAPGGSGGDAPAAVDPDAPVCESKMKESDADSHAMAGERPSAEHQLLFTTCTDPATGTSTQQVQWVLPGEDGLPVDPAVLAQRAVDGLRLPNPQIASSPADFALVKLPVWLWLEGASWQEQSASASVPGLTVTATATPVGATWSMGDGTTVTCATAGTKWTTSFDTEAESPTCGHTYTRTSAGSSGGEFEVAVTVEWAVSWSGGGVSGTEPGMTTTAQTSWPVAQSPALVKLGGTR